MKESYKQGLAAQFGPESCVGVRKDEGEALTGERVGRVLSCEIHAPMREYRVLRGADAVEEGGRQHSSRRYREMRRGPAQSETPCMHEDTLPGNREIPVLSAARAAAKATDRIGKSKDQRR